MQIRAEGQARSQEQITKTLTPEYLRYKLYDSPDSKVVLVPDQSKIPGMTSAGSEATGPLSPENSSQGASSKDKRNHDNERDQSKKRH